MKAMVIELESRLCICCGKCRSGWTNMSKIGKREWSHKRWMCVNN